ncbi:MAG: YihY/virulence factor BrkB family protein [Chitinophagales bacterium]
MIKNKLSQLKKLSLPGFNGVPIYNVLEFIWREVGRDSIHNRASAAAFNILLASFPTLLLFFSIIAYIPIQDFSTTLLDFVMYLLPLNAQEMARYTIGELIGTSSGSGGLLSLSVLLTLYFASNGVRSLMLALSGRQDTAFYNRSFLRRVLVSINVTLLIFLVTIISVVAILVGQYLINLLINSLHAESSFAVIGLSLLQIITAFLLVYNVIALIYRLAPVVENSKWGYVSPGTILATFCSLLFLKIFGYFVNTFGEFDKLYGSLGALIVLMVCYYGIALMLIIGFELNIGIQNRSKQLV